MELFDIVVRREILRRDYLVNSEGQEAEYAEKMKQLKKEVDDQDLYEKACLFDAVRQDVYLDIKYKDKTIRQDITPMLFDAFNQPMDYPKALEKLMNDVKYQYISNIDDYNKIIDEIIDGDYEDDEWFFNNQDADDEELNETYYRRRIVSLIEARLEYEKTSILADIDLDRDSSGNPLKELDDLVQEFDDKTLAMRDSKKMASDTNLSSAEREEASWDLDTIVRATQIIDNGDNDKDKEIKRIPTLIEKLDKAGIKKQVFYNYKNGKDVEFSKKFYFSVAVFLSFAGFKTENFLNMHGLSYMDSKVYNSDIYRDTFDYGLHAEAIEYMLNRRENDRINRQKALEEEAKEKKSNKTSKERIQDDVTVFRRSFNAKRDYFSLVIRLTTGTITDEERKILDYSVTYIDRILAEFISVAKPKVEKRFKTIENYKKVYTGDYLQNRIDGAMRKTRFQLPKIINKSVVDTAWDKEFYTIEDLIALRLEVEDVIFQLQE